MNYKCFLGMLLVAGHVISSHCQSSLFMYQGVLADRNQAANGFYDLQFRLADGATNGAYLGEVISQTNVPVNNGVFTVTLRVDASAFDGSARWLEIGVRTNGSHDAFTVLQPLQPIVATPYAAFASSAAAAGVASNLAAGAVLTGVSVPGGSIQPGSITSAQIDRGTDAAYRDVNTNAVAGIIANSALDGGRILPGTITFMEMDPATDLAYRRVDTNAVAAIIGSASISGTNIQTGSITPMQIDPTTDLAYRATDTNAVSAIVSSASINGSSIEPGTITVNQLDTNSVKAFLTGNSSSSAGSTRVNAKLILGAAGDGVTDDTAAIQAGLNYIASLGATNVTLYLPAGTYKLSDTLTLPGTSFPNDPVLGNNSGIRISGAGMSATKLVWSSMNNGVGLALTDWGYEGFTIEDLTLEGPLMTSWDSANSSIGLAMGKYGPYLDWSGWNNTVQNCGFIGWGYGATISNAWEIVFDNCVVTSNNFEGLRFVGSHGVSVQNCRVGGGWSTACGIGVGFHRPLDNGFGDNAQVMNCLIGPCTNGIFNEELNLVSFNNHLENCGSFYTLPGSSGAPSTTIIGGYTLDYPSSWTNGFAAQVLLDARSAARTVVQNAQFTTLLYPSGRAVFNVTNDGSGFYMPTYIGPGSLPCLWDTTSNVTLYPLGMLSATKPIKPLWSYQLPLKNGPDFTSGIAIAQSPIPWSVPGAMQIANGSTGVLEFPVPHGMGFSNLVVELTVQGVDGQTNMAFGLLEDNYSIGTGGPQRYGTRMTAFNGITNGSTSTVYWTNSFAEDLFPRRCHYTITSSDDPAVGVTNDLWIVSWRLFSVESN